MDAHLSPDEPLVPIQSALRLTRDQENRLVRLAMYGLRYAISDQEASGFMEIRKFATEQHAGDFSKRLSIPNSIYHFSNLSMNTCKRFVRITAARGFDDLLSTEPLLSVTPEGDEDSSEDARNIARLASYKITEAGAKSVLREAVLAACIRGEAVVKTVWEKRRQRFKKIARPLLDANDNPIKAVDGDYITDSDAWISREDGTKILARDPKIILVGKPKWGTESRITCHRQLFNGIDTKVLDYRDFLCGTTKRDVISSDFVAHRYDMPWGRLAGLFKGKESDPRVKNILDRLKTQITTKPGSEAEKPDKQRGETEPNDTGMPSVKVAECMMTVVLEEDGVADEIVILLDVENELPLYYDYTPNTVPPGIIRPLHVVRIEPNPGRWTGCGFYELFADRQKFIDLFFNRVNFRGSTSGRIDFSNPNATEETYAGERIQFGTGEVYTLRDGYDKEDAFSSVYIEPTDEAQKELMNMLLQATQLEAGMITAGDQSFSNLPSAGLATGIKSLDRVANTLLKNMFYDLVIGIEGCLNHIVAYTLRHFDTKEAAALMGEKRAMTLEAYRDTSRLPFKVKLLISNAKDEDILKANQQAIDVLISWESLTPEQRRRAAPLYIQILKTLGVQDVEKVLGLDQLSTLVTASQQTITAADGPLPIGAPGDQPQLDDGSSNTSQQILETPANSRGDNAPTASTPREPAAVEG